VYELTHQMGLGLCTRGRGDSMHESLSRPWVFLFVYYC
jgi:hypothetical protein